MDQNMSLKASESFASKKMREIWEEVDMYPIPVEKPVLW